MKKACRSRVSAFFSLAVLVILVVVLMFVMVTTRFRSLASPFIVVFSVPFTFANVVLKLTVARAPLNIVTLVNLVVLVKVIIGGNVILVSCAVLYQREKVKVLATMIATKGSHLHPMLVAALAAMLNVVPVTIKANRNSRV